MLNIRTRSIAIAAALFATLPANVAIADCTCRAAGRDHDLGVSVCLRTSTGFRLATCSMVLNNTSWKLSSSPCVDAQVRGPAGDQATPRTHVHHHPHGVHGSAHRHHAAHGR
jgi:hypothetical protein